MSWVPDKLMKKLKRLKEFRIRLDNIFATCSPLWTPQRETRTPDKSCSRNTFGCAGKGERSHDPEMNECAQNYLMHSTATDLPKWSSSWKGRNSSGWMLGGTGMLIAFSIEYTLGLPWWVKWIKEDSMVNRVMIHLMKKGWFYLVVISVVMSLIGCDYPYKLIGD